MNIDELCCKIRKCERRSIAKAITLIESHKKKDKEISAVLLENLRVRGREESHRIGITGIPGVGKSQFIEAIGLDFLKKKKGKLGVIAIDPSSPKKGGSILGDKIRMDKLSSDPRVFVRPCASQGSHGGVSKALKNIILLLESAGYSTILVESVGVGQEEYGLSYLVDMLILLQMPSTGDSVQFLKKGLLELVDLVVVNKNDGKLKLAALENKQALEVALNGPQDGLWHTPVLLTSSLYSDGIDEIWDKIDEFFLYQKAEGLFEKKRKNQVGDNLNKEVLLIVQHMFFDSKYAKKIFSLYQNKVCAKEMTIERAASDVVTYIKNFSE